jgi:hypothetical protein
MVSARALGGRIGIVCLTGLMPRLCCHCQLPTHIVSWLLQIELEPGESVNPCQSASVAVAGAGTAVCAPNRDAVQEQSGH